MKLYIYLTLFLSTTYSIGQNNYTSLTQYALESMWSSKDSVGYKTALDTYEQAFELYPDSIDATSLYKASVLASELKNNDKAFKYLTCSMQNYTVLQDYSSWKYILGNFSQIEYKNIITDPRWEKLKIKAIKDKELFYKALKDQQDEFFSLNTYSLDEIQNTKELYEKMLALNPYKAKANRNYSIQFDINDSIQTSFFIHLPKDYNPEKRYSLLFFLHGAVKNNALIDFQLANWNLEGWNRFYTKYAQENQVILVFPRANKQYNWMSPKDGFMMIPEMLKQLKTALNINDNKVFISGHSNGATGSFSYLMKNSTPFAGFYGFNTYPKVFTGGTFIENIKNRSYINFSTDQDYYYPPKANDDLSLLMNQIQADYKDFRFTGFPHWFPEFNESEPAFEILFKDLLQRERNPFPNEVTWEFDDQDYGSMDWLTDIKIDTLRPRSNWHSDLNFDITKWLEYEDLRDNKKPNLIVKDVMRKAFDFPRKSAKIRARYLNNTFMVETSSIDSFVIEISPEMVDMDKKIKVYVNGKLYFNDQVTFDRDYLLYNFENHLDRKQLWINQIEIKI